MSSKIKSATIIIVVILILITIVFFAYREALPGNTFKRVTYTIINKITNHDEQDRRDSRRIVDLKFIAMFLEKYYEKNKHYPADSNLDSLKISLVEIDKSVSGFQFVDTLFPKQNYSYAVK